MLMGGNPLINILTVVFNWGLSPSFSTQEKCQPLQWLCVLYKNGGHKVVFNWEPTTSFFHTVVVSNITGVTVLFKVRMCLSTQLCLLFKGGRPLKTWGRVTCHPLGPKTCLAV